MKSSAPVRSPLPPPTRLIAPLIAVAAALAPGCSEKPPDWAFLSQVEIPSVLTCGREGMSAESLVRLAYEGDRFGALPDPEPLPIDVISAAGSLGAYRHFFPCAASTDDAKTALETSGYTELRLKSESPRAFVFEGRDPVGVEGRYLRFACAWVSDITQDLDPPPPWSVLNAGLDGTFATIPATGPERLGALGELAAITFRARMVRPTPAARAYLERGPVFVGVAGALLTGPFPGERDPIRDVLPLCATWVEHDAFDRCDRIYLGVSFQLFLDESLGLFHQSVLVRQSLLAPGTDRGLEGFCRHR